MTVVGYLLELRSASSSFNFNGRSRTLIHALEILGDIWRQASTAVSAAPNCADPVSNRSTARTPTVLPTGTYDSFNRLPAHLRGNSKYAWANPINRPSHAGASSNVDSYRPPYSSSRSAGSPPHSSSRYESMRETYRPPAAESMSTSSLTHDYLSSSSKGTSYPGTARPTTAIINPYEEAHVARAIQHEMPQRQSSQLKKPGILKRQSNVNNSGDSALSDMINPARKALFAEPDVEMGEIVEKRGGRPTGTKANREVLPFNRLEQRRESGGDTEMRGGGS